MPQNVPEEVSRRKIVEELLDRIVERGFLTLGEVRDAISRNHVKEPDCSGPKSFLRGEAALRADRRLTDALDGVYEPGEFYLRWILRFSHVMFGTWLGRCITKYLAIPFGGAVVTLIVAEHVAEPLTGREEFYAPTWSYSSSYGPMVLVGIFLFGLIHIPRFRRITWELVKLMGRAIRLLLWDSPRWFFNLPWVEKIIRSSAGRLVMNFVVKPLVPTAIVAAYAPPPLASWPNIVCLASMYTGLALLASSRVGRNLEEMAMDAISEGWQRFGVRPLVGLFWFIVDFFHLMLQGIERMLYTVDEWLRFRSGQGPVMLVVKGVLGVVWFFVAYIVRFCVNLLIEPQINPLKHIPWVSVSHKIMAPIWYQIGLLSFLNRWMSPLAADVTAFVIVSGTPGIFGFLIWELKENWRLFAANRPKNLRPGIGSHGETMPRLLRPGFHSGTIPKRFAKLRRAERKALRNGDYSAARKHREVLHHVETDLQRYIEREFAAWFDADCDWSGPRPQPGEVRLATNEASIVVVQASRLPDAADAGETPVPQSLVMSFRIMEAGVELDLSGRLGAEQLMPPAREVFRLALLNVLKTAGVELFDDRTEATIAAHASKAREAGVIVVPWAEWIAAWENCGKSNDSPWNVFAVE